MEHSTSPYIPKNSEQAWQIIEAQLGFLRTKPLATPKEMGEFTQQFVAQAKSLAKTQQEQ